MMTGGWWWVWMLIMFLWLVPPLGSGWGYRGWGAPYPSYVQRRRAERAATAGNAASFDHYSWGWGGDLLWVGVVFGLFWLCSALWWR